MRGKKLSSNYSIARLLAGIFIFLFVLPFLNTEVKAENGQIGPIILSEISPINGTSYSEYLEFYNSGNEAIDLYGWKINYAWGSSSRNHTISNHISVEPEKYLSYSISENGVLRDSSGFVQLIDAQGNLVGKKIEYGTAVENTIGKDQSLSFIDSKWQLTTTQTPGNTNMLTSPAASVIAPEDSGGGDIEMAITPISDAKKMDMDKLVLVSGIVTVLPGEISDSYFYIQDEAAGIQIYSYHKSFPELKRGERIKVDGIMSQSNGEIRLKIVDPENIEVVGLGEMPAPKEINFSDLASLEGQYITLHGNISNPSGSEFFISDTAGNSIKVLVKNNDFVQKPRLFSGSAVIVTGIVSQYKDSYRILPFAAGSVKILTQELPKAGANSVVFYLLLYLTFSIWFTYLIQKKRLKNSLTISPNPLKVELFLPCVAILVVGRLLLLRVLPAAWESKKLSLAPPLLL